jgi:hypothetical protein
MKVVATQMVYYAYGDDPRNHKRRYPADWTHKRDAGVPFELEKLEHYSPSSMEIVEATDEERARVKEILAEREARLKELRQEALGNPRKKGGRHVA